MAKQDELDAVEAQRHEVRVLLVEGHITGLQLLARMRELDQVEEGIRKRAFAIYMRILDQEKGKKEKQSKESFRDSQRRQAEGLLAELKAKLAKIAT